MTDETTVLIIKPDAVSRGCIGRILSRVEARGFQIDALRVAWLLKESWMSFYAGLRERIPEEAYKDHIAFMASGPVVFVRLRKENAVKDLRSLAGATDPAKAEFDTIRRYFGTKLPRNAVHASDSVDSALRESEFMEW